LSRTPSAAGFRSVGPTAKYFPRTFQLFFNFAVKCQYNKSIVW